jgi:hypothetical protein
MHEQPTLIVEQEEQILALSLYLRNAAALEPLLESRWRGQECVVGARRPYFGDASIHDGRTQPKANYFDFGQLGHGPGDMVASLLRVK